MNPAQYLIDTSALARLLTDQDDAYGWGGALTAGLVGICRYTEIEFLYSARSAADRTAKVEAMHVLLPEVFVPDRVLDRAWEVQRDLTANGPRRGPGPIDLIVAATAELSGLTLLHMDNDFTAIAAVTGQSLRRLATGKEDYRETEG